MTAASIRRRASSACTIARLSSGEVHPTPSNALPTPHPPFPPCLLRLAQGHPGAGLSLVGATSLTRCDRPTICQVERALRQARASRMPMVATGATQAPCTPRSTARWPLSLSVPRRLPRPPSASPALVTFFSPSARRLAAPTGPNQRCTAAAARKVNGNAAVAFFTRVAATKLPTAHSAALAATHALREANASPSLIRHS